TTRSPRLVDAAATALWPTRDDRRMQCSASPSGAILGRAFSWELGGLHDGSDGVGSAQIAAGVRDAEDAFRSGTSDHRGHPSTECRKTISEAVEEGEVDEQ